MTATDRDPDPHGTPPDAPKAVRRRKARAEGAGAPAPDLPATLPADLPADPVAAAVERLTEAAASPPAAIVVPPAPVAVDPTPFHAPPPPLPDAAAHTSPPSHSSESIPMSVTDISHSAQHTIEQGTAALNKGVEDLTALSRDNVEAMMKAMTTVARGLEEMQKAWMAYAHHAMEKQMAFSKAVLTVKTLKDLTDLQADFTRTQFDSFMSEATRLSEIGVKVANEAFEPLAQRMTEAMEAAKPPLAV